MQTEDVKIAKMKRENRKQKLENDTLGVRSGLIHNHKTTAKTIRVEKGTCTSCSAVRTRHIHVTGQKQGNNMQGKVCGGSGILGKAIRNREGLIRWVKAANRYA